MAGAAELAQREKDFYNSKGATYDRLRAILVRSIGEFSRVEEHSRFFDPAGKDVLEYGCGPGNGLQRLIRRGVDHVTGFDVSDAEVGRAQQRARELGVSERTEYMVADAHHTPFADDSFDLIVGGSILHHLDLEVALREIRRILRPGGRAVFYEPLAHNPLLRLGRRLTPAARTPDEHPITRADWELCRSIFPGFWHQEYEFLTIPFMPLNLILNRRGRAALARAVSGWDDALLARRPALRPYARLSFMILE